MGYTLFDDDLRRRLMVKIGEPLTAADKSGGVTAAGQESMDFPDGGWFPTLVSDVYAAASANDKSDIGGTPSGSATGVFR